VLSRQNGKATIIANNWDRFGGRALDILNGYVLSLKLDCNFVFYWPEDDRFPEMEEQINFFSQIFIDQHRIKSCPPTEEMHSVEFNLFDFAQAQRIVNGSEKNEFIKNIDFMALPKFTDEDQSHAQKIYSEKARLVISPSHIKLWERQKELYSDFDAIHGRYGDLINGSFSQYVDTGKYVDTFSLKVLAEKLIMKNREVVILTDTPEISNALEKVFRVKLQPSEISASGGEKLSYFELQTIELFILASSKTIYASSSSAFSILASRLGNVPIRTIRGETADVLASRPWEFRRSRLYSKLDKKIRGEVRSRDLLSILQYYWKSLDFKAVKSLIDDAYRADGDYVLSLCLSAIIAKIDLNSIKAEALIERAEVLARSRSNIHDDPLMLTLLVRYFLLKHESSHGADEVKREMSELNPYQFSKHHALMFVIKSDNLVTENPRLNGVMTEIHTHWNEVAMSDETELVFALLTLLEKNNH
jgi:hypothetical protein